MHCVVSLSKTLYPVLSILVQPRKNCPDVTEKLLNGMQRIKQNRTEFYSNSNRL